MHRRQIRGSSDLARSLSDRGSSRNGSIVRIALFAVVLFTAGCTLAYYYPSVILKSDSVWAKQQIAAITSNQGLIADVSNSTGKARSKAATAPTRSPKLRRGAPVDWVEGTPAKWSVIAEVYGANGEKIEIVDEPIPEECNAHPNLDVDGEAVKWGLDHKTPSAAECCRRCMAMLNETKPCHAWVWCGDPSGVCWTPDIHNHTTGACWLKYQQDWDKNTDLAESNLKINFRGNFSEPFRAEHKTAPEQVPWTAGVIQQQPAGTGPTKTNTAVDVAGTAEGPGGQAEVAGALQASVAAKSTATAAVPAGVQ